MLKIYNNKIDLDTLDPVKRGFLFSAADDATQNFADQDNHDEFTALSQKEYSELFGYEFTLNNIDSASVKKLFAVVDEFCIECLSRKQFKMLKSMDDAEKMDFGMNLYDARMYDSGNMDGMFLDAVDKLKKPTGMPLICQSVHDDIRIIFK